MSKSSWRISWLQDKCLQSISQKDVAHRTRSSINNKIQYENFRSSRVGTECGLRLGFGIWKHARRPGSWDWCWIYCHGMGDVNILKEQKRTLHWSLVEQYGFPFPRCSIGTRVRLLVRRKNCKLNVKVICVRLMPGCHDWVWLLDVRSNYCWLS